MIDQLLDILSQIDTASVFISIFALIVAVGCAVFAARAVLVANMKRLLVIAAGIYLIVEGAFLYLMLAYRVSYEYVSVYTGYLALTPILFFAALLGAYWGERVDLQFPRWRAVAKYGFLFWLPAFLIFIGALIVHTQ